ncbi:MAG: tetratricopeptide repeat protein [Spirochaetaceae bacterium]|jgi:tetratricopeptide (TPR) repeat protein|nr:tetratricopeptide repeat protein [Spirochaetaceae bacterium]
MKKIKILVITPDERKKQRQRITRGVLALLVFAGIVLSSFLFYHRTKSRITLRAVHELWKQEDYQGVYTLTAGLLASFPLDSGALAYRGFAAYYLAARETDLSKSQSFLEEGIISLRKALYKANKRIQPQINYMLGKAYFLKNTLSAYYYYADMVVFYLNEAVRLGFSARDIPEILGLSYGALNMTTESVMAFTEALKVRDSDVLELAIAEQKYKLRDYDSAKPYLFKVARSSKDDVFIKQSHALLGQIYIDEGHYDDARREFQAILDKDPASSDAYYGFGLVYEKEGDYPRARAEWRRALRYDVNHPGALQKLADSR